MFRIYDFEISDCEKKKKKTLLGNRVIHKEMMKRFCLRKRKTKSEISISYNKRLKQNIKLILLTM